jgi:hypothetical protein
MKKFNFKNSGLLMIVVMLLCSVFGVGGAEMLTADVVNPSGGGAVDVATTTTVTETKVNSDQLILDTIDEKVTKVRPYDAVLDTIARQIKDVKKSNNQVVRHYAIDVLDVTAKVNTAYETGGDAQITLDTDNNSIFANDQTILVKGIPGYLEDQTTQDTANDLMLYVISKSNGKPVVVPINGKKTGQTLNTIPAIAKDTELLRMGRAGSELQIQSDAYSGVPTDFEQYLQKFMIQIEESTLFAMADKEVDWNFNDQEEEAIFEMRQTTNNSLWFGVKGKRKLQNSRASKAEDIYFTGGIWNMAGKEFDFEGETVSSVNLVTLMKEAFTGNASGKVKILIAGSGLLEALEQVEYTKTVSVGAKSQKHGIEFNSIVSKFGTLLIVHDQSFDRAFKTNCGFILDADYLRKWTMGWKTQKFDFKSSGEKDAEGRMLMEIYGLVLKNPNAHMRVFLDQDAA